VEKFGVKSSLWEVTSRLAFCSTPDNFASDVMIVGDDLTALLSEGKNTRD
jgi:hypothetical protein